VHEKYSSKTDVLWATSNRKFYELLFFMESTVTNILWLVTLLKKDCKECVFPPPPKKSHHHHLPSAWLTETPESLYSPEISQTATSCCRHGRRSRCGFLWEFVPWKQRSLLELSQGIAAAAASINGDTLYKVWEEMDYHLDVCRTTREARIDSLWSVCRTLSDSLPTNVSAKF
jgi:hypothetical protein